MFITSLITTFFIHELAHMIYLGRKTGSRVPIYFDTKSRDWTVGTDANYRALTKKERGRMYLIGPFAGILSSTILALTLPPIWAASLVIINVWASKADFKEWWRL